MSNTRPLRIYVDGSFSHKHREDGYSAAGAGLVCVTFKPWIGKGWAFETTRSTDAEMYAVACAIEFAEGVPAEIITDCMSVGMNGSRIKQWPDFKVPANIRIRWMGNHAQFPAHQVAHNIAHRAMRKQVDVAAHSVQPPENWLWQPARARVVFRSGRIVDAILVADDGNRAYVHLQQDDGRFAKTLSSFPSKWVERLKGSVR